MPIGIQRLNARKSQPNTLIIFIKPLKGPDEATAQDFLERIAAQCLPIMRENHLSVMSLEEYEPNPEFVGRNFNAGEVIQLVLKSRSGRWLPFKYVQMVMMHELAHCKQMNHSRAFWALRNNYAEQMRQLWLQGYTGEGLWGRGALLTTGEFETNTVHDNEVLPEHLCGGTYRSRRRKRKAKGQLTYQQQKERRILKKFGANGVALGEDENIKMELENGKRTQAKPRVAQSKRGRELRAAAALARFDQQKKSQEDTKNEVKIKQEDDTATGDESETSSESDADATAAMDINGKRLLDAKGHRMIKVCEDENPDDYNAQNEMRELQSSMNTLSVSPESPSRKLAVIKQENDAQSRIKDLPLPDAPATSKTKPISAIRTSLNTCTHGDGTKITSESKAEIRTDGSKEGKKHQLGKTTQKEKKTQSATHEVVRAMPTRSPSVAAVRVCPLCSTENGPISLTCMVCSHVLDSLKDSRAWGCTSVSCLGSVYLNAGDAGACGICGERKPGI